MFSESSIGCWGLLELPCCLSKQKELSENMLQNLFNKLPPQTVAASPLPITHRTWLLCAETRCPPTLRHLLASPTMASASMRPKPNLELKRRPAALVCHPGLSASGTEDDERTTRCCTSRHVKEGLHEE